MVPIIMIMNTVFFTAMLYAEKRKWKSLSYSLWPHGLYSPWDGDLPNPEIKPRSPELQMDSLPAEPPGKPRNTGMGSLFLLQGIFPTQRSNPGLPHGRWILYQMSHQGNLRILEWVAYPFFRGSSWPRDRTGVSCIAGRFFTSWAIREAPRCREEPANLKFILIGLVNCIGTDH